jgi:hypothetical protein
MSANAAPWASATCVNADDSASLPESLRVLCWRLAQLNEAGYDDAEAFVLATVLAVDLHQAVDLIQRGCSHEVALRILL